MSCKALSISFSPPLPLAMYQELAAHLRQVNSVEVEMVSQNASNFDYSYSQIAGITVSHGDENVELVQKILNFYGSWQELEA